jgi:hypothetical protein
MNGKNGHTFQPGFFLRPCRRCLGTQTFKAPPRGGGPAEGKHFSLFSSVFVWNQSKKKLRLRRPFGPFWAPGVGVLEWAGTQPPPRGPKINKKKKRSLVPTNMSTKIFTANHGVGYAVGLGPQWSAPCGRLTSCEAVGPDNCSAEAVGSQCTVSTRQSHPPNPPFFYPNIRKIFLWYKKIAEAYVSIYPHTHIYIHTYKCIYVYKYVYV